VCLWLLLLLLVFCDGRLVHLFVRVFVFVFWLHVAVCSVFGCLLFAS